VKSFMATARRFAAFSQDGREGLGMAQVPSDGLCISTFIVIRERNHPGKRILAGRLNPGANWDYIGAINPGRLERSAKGWMLPSSHLIMLESPESSARRILREQLGVSEEKANLDLRPIVFSDVSNQPDHPNHWDIGFVFRGILSREDLPKNPEAWAQLDFVDFDSTPKTDFVRSQQDVVDYALREQ
jgi:ADP-ribose pyrophosphatase YjhB (NUDIX family)